MALPPPPAHVPAEQIGVFPLTDGTLTYEDPFVSLIPAYHDGPAAFFGPSAYMGFEGAWVLRRGEDIKHVYRDTEHFSSGGAASAAAWIGEDWKLLPIELDPPEHKAMRDIVSPLFTPKRIMGLEAKVRQTAKGYLQKFAARGHADFVAEFTTPFPVAVFLDLVDLPREDMDLFLDWAHAMLRSTILEERADAIRAVKDFLVDVLEQRRRSPSDDFFSYIIAAKIDGKLLSQDEMIGIAFNLFLGGLDTVNDSMALQFRHLAEHPADQQTLRDDPSRIVVAVEELLRAYASVTNYRFCVKPFEIAGVSMKPGDRVALPTSLAARDPEMFDRPQEIDFSRTTASLTFAYGPHRCVGSHLARRELQIAMTEVLVGIPQFKIEEGAKLPVRYGPIISLEALPLVW